MQLQIYMAHLGVSRTQFTFSWLLGDKMKDCLLYNSSEINPVHLINALLISIVLFLHHGSYMNNYFHILSEYKINMLLQKPLIHR